MVTTSWNDITSWAVKISASHINRGGRARSRLAPSGLTVPPVCQQLLIDLRGPETNLSDESCASILFFQLQKRLLPGFSCTGTVIRLFSWTPLAIKIAFIPKSHRAPQELRVLLGKQHIHWLFPSTLWCSSASWAAESFLLLVFMPLVSNYKMGSNRFVIKSCYPLKAWWSGVRWGNSNNPVPMEPQTQLLHLAQEDGQPKSGCELQKWSQWGRHWGYRAQGSLWYTGKKALALGKINYEMTGVRAKVGKEKDQNGSVKTPSV